MGEMVNIRKLPGCIIKKQYYREIGLSVVAQKATALFGSTNFVFYLHLPTQSLRKRVSVKCKTRFFLFRVDIKACIRDVHIQGCRSPPLVSILLVN